MKIKDITKNKVRTFEGDIFEPEQTFVTVEKLYNGISIRQYSKDEHNVLMSRVGKFEMYIFDTEENKVFDSLEEAFKYIEEEL